MSVGLSLPLLTKSALLVAIYFFGFFVGRSGNKSERENPIAFSQGDPGAGSHRDIALSRSSFIATEELGEPRRRAKPSAGDMILSFGRLGNQVQPGELRNALGKLVSTSAELPIGARTAAWSSFLSEAFLATQSGEVSELVLSPGEQLVSDLNAQRILDGTTLWDYLVANAVTKAINEGKAEDLVDAATIKFTASSQEGFEQQKKRSAEVVARVYANKPLSALSDLTYLDAELLTSVHLELLEHFARVDRKKGFDFLISVEATEVSDYAVVSKVLNQGWFDSNATELSTTLANAPASPNKDLVIARMVELIGEDDPSAARAWLDEIEDPEIRKRATDPAAVGP